MPNVGLFGGTRLNHSEDLARWLRRMCAAIGFAAVLTAPLVAAAQPDFDDMDDVGDDDDDDDGGGDGGSGEPMTPPPTTPPATSRRRSACARPSICRSPSGRSTSKPASAS